MANSVFPSDEKLFPLLMPKSRTSFFRKIFSAEVKKRKDELDAPLDKALSKYRERGSTSNFDRAVECAQHYHLHALEVLEPWMDHYLKEGVVDSYPENKLDMGSVTEKVGNKSIKLPLEVDYLRALEGIWGLNEVDWEANVDTPGLHKTLHELHVALHPVRMWKSLLRLIGCALPLAVGSGLVWYFKLGRYMGTINTVRVDGYADDEHVMMQALGYDCLRLLGVLLIAIGIMMILYGLIRLVENGRDWRKQKRYRRAMDRLALDAYRAVRFYQLWAAHEGRELNLCHAQAVLDDYAAHKGGQGGAAQ